MFRSKPVWVALTLCFFAPLSQAQIIIGFGTPAPKQMTQGNHPASLSLAQLPRPSTTLGIQRNPVYPFGVAHTFGGVNPLFPAYLPVQPIVINQYVPTPIPSPVVVAEAPPVLPQPAPIIRERAQLKISTPPSVEVWIDGKKYGTHGGPFIVDSPELKPGERYGFSVKLVWPGRDIPEEEVITVQGGQERSVSILGTVRK